MTQLLRQSTEIIVRIGPAVAVGDGFTPVTTLDLSTADEAELLKANTTTTTSIAAATMAAITGCDGWYGLTLTTSLTDTVGCLDVMVNDDSLILPIFARFQVIEEAAYDAIYVANADPKADVNVATIDANAITADAIAANAIGASELAADAVAEIADAVWDEAASGHTTPGTTGNYLFNLFFQAVAAVGAVDDASATTTEFNTSLTQVDDIWNDQTLVFITGNLSGHARVIQDYQNTNGRVVFDEALVAAPDNGSLFIVRGDHVHPITQIQSGLATSAALQTVDDEIATIDGNVDAIKAKTDSLTFTVAGKADSNITHVNEVEVGGAGTEGSPWSPA